jgi:YD repeat-containing protein
LTQPECSKADLPPLATYDKFEPYHRGGPLEHSFYDDINLFERSLFGVSYAVGPVELQYDESYAESSSSYASNVAGNFTFKAYSFVNGLQLGLPVVDGSSVRDGTFRYSLGNPQQAEAGWDYSFRTLTESGRYVLVEFTGGQRVLDDTLLSIRYDLTASASYPWVLLPTRAHFPDGEEAVIEWNAADSTASRAIPTRMTLSKNGLEIERVEFDWTTTAPYRLNRVRSLVGGASQYWRWVSLEYGTTALQPLVKLVRVTLGGTSSAPFAAGIVRSGLVFAYQVAGTKDIISGISNFQGKTLKTFLFSSGQAVPTGPIRTLYTGLRLGTSGQQATTFGYTPSINLQDRLVSITRPQVPNDALTVRLHGTRGSSVEERRASCPAPLRLVEFLQAGPLAGLVNRETLRPSCSTPLIIDYRYGTTGSIEEVVMSGRDSSGALVSRTTTMRSEKRTDPNGLRRLLLTEKTDALGNTTRWSYDSNARIRSEEYVPDGIQSDIAYTYWDSGQRHVRSARFLDANGREDTVEYDQRGFLIRETAAKGTSLEASSTWAYDSAFRPEVYTDVRGKTTRFSYLPDGRLQSGVTSAPSGLSRVSTTIQYHADFPQEVTREENRVRESGGEVTSWMEWNYVPNLPLVYQTRMGGDGVAQPITLLEAQYDPATLRLQRMCQYKSPSSNEGCDSFSYYPSGSGLKTGLLQKIDVAGGSAAGGLRKTFLYDTFSDYLGTTWDDGVEVKTLTEELDDFGQVARVFVNPGEGINEERLTYSFDRNNKLTRQQRYFGGVLISDVQAGYDDNGRSYRPTFVTESVSGSQSIFYYNDSLKRLTGQETFTSGGLRATALSIDAGNLDVLDRPWFIEKFLDGRGQSALAYTYDRKGDVRTVRDELGNLMEFEYDSFGRSISGQTELVSSAQSYAVIGSSVLNTLVTSNRVSNPALEQTQETVSAVDALGRIVRVEDVNNGTRVENSFNARGFTTSQVYTLADASTRSFNYGFDALGRMVSASLNGGNLLGRTFSGLGRLLATRDARQNQTSFQYDRLGRTSHITYPDGSQSRLISATNFYPPQPNGAVFRANYVDRGGATVTTEVNSLGKIVRMQSTGGSLENASTDFVYSGHRLSSLSQTSPRGSSALTVGYDGAGRATSERTQVWSSLQNLDFTLSREFDQLGRVVGHLYPDGMWSYAYYERDSLGRIIRIWFNGSPVAEYNYDGPVLTGVALGDVARTFTYDADHGQVSEVLDRVGASTLTQLRLEYDSKGRISSRTDRGVRRGNLPQLSESLAYSNDDYLSVYSFSSPLFGTGSRSYMPQPDAILGAVSPSVDSMFQLPARFTYDNYGNPRTESSYGRSFQWTRSGLRRLSAPEVTADFVQDALRRTVWISKTLPLFTRDIFQVREEGMVLVQEEVNR